LENSYLRKRPQKQHLRQDDSGSSPEISDEDFGSEEGSDMDQATAPPTHESATKKLGDNIVKKSKYNKPDESKESKDRRTIFIGNLPVEVAKSKAS
jgi:nucleolar protein 12